MRARTPAGLATTSIPSMMALPAVGTEEGGEDAHDGGLARAVGPEQAEHGAGGDGEVDTAEGLGVTEALDDALRFHSWTG